MEEFNSEASVPVRYAHGSHCRVLGCTLASSQERVHTLFYRFTWIRVEVNTIFARFFSLSPSSSLDVIQISCKIRARLELPCALLHARIITGTRLHLVLLLYMGSVRVNTVFARFFFAFSFFFPRCNTDQGVTKQAFSPLPTTVCMRLHFYREQTSAHSSLVGLNGTMVHGVSAHGGTVIERQRKKRSTAVCATPGKHLLFLI